MKTPRWCRSLTMWAGSPTSTSQLELTAYQWMLSVLYPAYYILLLTKFMPLRDFEGVIGKGTVFFVFQRVARPMTAIQALTVRVHESSWPAWKFCRIHGGVGSSAQMVLDANRCSPQEDGSVFNVTVCNFLFNFFQIYLHPSVPCAISFKIEHN